MSSTLNLVQAACVAVAAVALFGGPSAAAPAVDAPTASVSVHD